MADPTNDPKKPSDTQSSREIASGGRNLADLLGSAELGVKITGIVLTVEEPKEFAGTSKGGKAYKFVQRRFQIWTGNKAVECGDRFDNIIDFPPIAVGTKVALTVTNIRANGNALSFDVKTA